MASISKIKLPNGNEYDLKDSGSLQGSYGSSQSTFLRNDGTWATPPAGAVTITEDTEFNISGTTFKIQVVT